MSGRIVDLVDVRAAPPPALLRIGGFFESLVLGLGEASTVRDAFDVVERCGLRALGASACRVLLWQEDRLRLVGPRPQPATAGVAGLDPRDSGPIAQAFHTGGIVITGTHAAVPVPSPRRAPTLEDTLLHLDPPPSMAVLAISWPTVVPPDLTARLGGAAEMIGRALHRFLLHEAHLRLVEGLQREVFAPARVSVGLEVATTYRVGGVQVGLGGDWHEVIRLDEQRTAFVIGDVVGHGGIAVGRMTRVRGVIGALLLTDADPATLWQRTARVLGALDDPFVGTAAVCIVDLKLGLITYVRAGHLPLCLRAADGSVALLDGGHGPALGLPTGRTVPGVASFGVGDLVLAYTDGLVERRGEDLGVGLERLARDVAGWGPGHELGAALAEVVGRASTHDDVTALAVRRR
jgi:hypothetical protein